MCINDWLTLEIELRDGFPNVHVEMHLVPSLFQRVCDGM